MPPAFIFSYIIPPAHLNSPSSFTVQDEYHLLTHVASWSPFDSSRGLLSVSSRRPLRPSLRFPSPRDPIADIPQPSTRYTSIPPLHIPTAIHHDTPTPAPTYPGVHCPSTTHHAQHILPVSSPHPQEAALPPLQRCSCPYLSSRRVSTAARHRPVGPPASRPLPPNERPLSHLRRGLILNIRPLAHRRRAQQVQVAGARLPWAYLSARRRSGARIQQGVERSD